MGGMQGQYRTRHPGSRLTYNTNVPVHGGYPVVGILLHQFASHELLEREHHAILAADADCGPSILDRLHCVFDLEVAAIGGEDGIGQIVACTYRGLRWRLDPARVFSRIVVGLPWLRVMGGGVSWTIGMAQSVLGQWGEVDVDVNAEAEAEAVM
jgi:hypothetical protein